MSTKTCECPSTGLETVLDAIELKATTWASLGPTNVASQLQRLRTFKPQQGRYEQDARGLHV